MSVEPKIIYLSIISFAIISVNSLTLMSLMKGEPQTLYNVSVLLKFGDKPTKLESSDQEISLKVQQIINEIKNGTTKLDLPSLSPFNMTELQPIKINVKDLLLAHSHVKNINVWGLEHLVIKKLDTNLGSLQTIFSASIPKLIINADYSLRGTILRALAYNPRGHFKAIVTDMNFTDTYLALKIQNNIVQINSLHGHVYLDSLMLKITGLSAGKYKLFQGLETSLLPVTEHHKQGFAKIVEREIINHFNKMLRKYAVTRDMLHEYLELIRNN